MIEAGAVLGGAVVVVVRLAFQSTALAMCAYALMVRMSMTGRSVATKSWLWSILQILGTLSLGSTFGCAAGDLIAAAVVIGCIPAYILLRRTGQACACFGNDARFMVRVLPIGISLGAMVAAVWMADIVPGGPWIWDFSRLVIAALATALMMGVAVYAQHRLTRQSSVAEGERRWIQIDVGMLGTKAEPADNARLHLGFFGEIGCAACATAMEDVVAFVKAFGDRFDTTIAIRGYPPSAPAAFQGATIVPIDELPHELSLRIAPTLFLTNGRGRFVLFEGLDNVRLGLGQALAGLR